MPAVFGCFVQPLVGASSDSCTHPWGRRKPFIAVGAIGVSVSIISLAWAGSTGYWVAAVLFSAGPVAAAGTIAKTCAVLSVCMLSLAVQPLQCGLRALIFDLCPPEQQGRAQAWAARFSSLGQILGCVAGLLGNPRTTSSEETLTFRMLSVMAVLAVTSTVVVTCFCVEEPSLHHTRGRQESERFPLLGIIHTLSQTCSKGPSLMRSVLSIQILSWMGWFTFLFYNTRFVRPLKPSSYHNTSVHNRLTKIA